ncbi:MAG: hypothetical protein DMD61_14560, partial [Gemmatimonadetes bacterium]
MLLLVGVAGPYRAAAAQGVPPDVVAQRAESLRVAGRPWHAAETLLAVAAREPHLNATFVVEGAKAELHARRYDRARGLLVGQPWLDDYNNGEALGVLAEAEAKLGQAAAAALHYAGARARATGVRAALLAVREGLAWEGAGQADSAAAAYCAALAAGLPAIDAWLRLRLARVTRDTAAAFRLLVDLPAPAGREAGAARAQALLAAGDSTAALEALAQVGRSLDVARLALVALARAMKFHGAAADAKLEVERALRQGDSSASTLVLAGELFATTGRYREAERAYRAAARDPALGSLAIYRRARVLVRLGDAGAQEALSGFAQSYPSDTAAPTALYTLGDMLVDRGDWGGAEHWFGDLIARYPTDVRTSLARFRLAAQALREGLSDSAAGLFRSEIEAGAPQRLSARFWLGRLERLNGDSAAARADWMALAREDSIGYYGLRARRELGMPPLRIAAATLPAPTAAIAAALGRIDTLLLAGLDTAAQAEVRALLGRAPQSDVESLLAWSGSLAARGFGPAAVRLGWQAALKAPNDARVLRAIFPWPNRRVVEAEAAE